MTASSYRLFKAIAIAVAVILGAAFMFWQIKENGKNSNDPSSTSRFGTDFNDEGDSPGERMAIGFRYAKQDEVSEA